MQYLHAVKVMQQYLSVPPMSVASERLCSKAGNLYTYGTGACSSVDFHS